MRSVVKSRFILTPHDLLLVYFFTFFTHNLLTHAVMITLEDLPVTGINAPKAHQRLIADLIVSLGNRYRSGELDLEPLPETMIDEGQTSPVPDVMLFDNEHDETPVIIEVAHGTGVKADRQKVKSLVDSNKYGIREGFIYDYKNEAWHKYRKGKGFAAKKTSYSDTLKLDLASLLADNR
jgi:Uma2 family endonuclease